MGTSTRERIIDAAADVMRTRGFARTTTKEIARTAGFSEATLYKHFADKTDLFLAVLRERMPSFAPLLERLVAHAGEGELKANLTEIATAAYAFYAAHFPTLGSIFSEPAILAAHRDNLRKVGAGPHRANERVVDYLRAEQQHGRVAAGADLELAAAMLLGACFQTAFLASFEGGDTAGDAARDAAGDGAPDAAGDGARGTPGDTARRDTAGDPGAARTGTRLDPAALGGTIERILTSGGAS